MRRILVLACVWIGLAACASTTSPPVSPIGPAPTQPSVIETATTAPTNVPVASGASSCTTANAAPPDKFRADDPAKFAAASGKPKLVEFFAYW